MESAISIVLFTLETVRVVSLLAGLGLGVNLSGFSIWWHTVLSGVPSLLFQIAFSILIMFWYDDDHSSDIYGRQERN